MPRRRRSWSGQRPRPRHGATAIDHLAAPEVRLGRRLPGSVAPAVYAIVERGCMKRPERARALHCQVEVRMTGFPPVRMTFAGYTVYVEDAPPDDEAIEPPGEEHTGEELVAFTEDEPEPVGDRMLDTEERMARFAPDLVASGEISDLVALFTTPMVRGIPNLAQPAGWEAISWLAAGRVRFRGSLLRARQVIQLLQI